MDGISAGNEPDAEPMSTDILQDILDGSQYRINYDERTRYGESWFK